MIEINERGYLDISKLTADDTYDALQDKVNRLTIELRQRLKVKEAEIAELKTKLANLEYTYYFTWPCFDKKKDETE